MSRIRSVKPEFFTSIPIADLTRDARLLFIGLWTHVDDEGRCVDDPRLIKAAIFPLDDDLNSRKVDALVIELANKRRITRYTVDGRRYLAVRGWEHQKIDRRAASRLPAPPEPLVEGSSNTRRDVDEPSSPDLRICGSGSVDRDQGSTDQDQGSSSSCESSSAPPPSDDDEPSIVQEAIHAIAVARTKRRPRENPAGYLFTVTNDLLANPTHRRRIAELHRREPSLNAGDLGMAYEAITNKRDLDQPPETMEQRVARAAQRNAERAAEREARLNGASA